MGIVYSTFAPTAVRLAYICQKLFDPKYSCIEDVQASSNSSPPEVSPASAELQQQVQSSSSLCASTKVELLTLTAVQTSTATQESTLLPATLQTRIHAIKSNSLPRYNNAKAPDFNYSLHQQNRNRRARQIRYKTRPSSFDGALIIRAKTKNSVIVTSTPSPLSRHWDAVTSSSSGCSSDSNSNSESDSETELRVSTNASNEEIGRNTKKLAMTAEDEEDFRLTLGRGHFSRSKKDRFFNNLRLQKASTAASLW